MKLEGSGVPNSSVKLFKLKFTTPALDPPCPASPVIVMSSCTATIFVAPKLTPLLEVVAPEAPVTVKLCSPVQPVEKVVTPGQTNSSIVTDPELFVRDPLVIVQAPDVIDSAAKLMTAPVAVTPYVNELVKL